MKTPGVGVALQDGKSNRLFIPLHDQELLLFIYHLPSKGPGAVDQLQHVFQLLCGKDIPIGIRPDLLGQESDRIDVIQVCRSDQ